MTNIVNDLRLLESGARWVDTAAADTLERAADEIERLRDACTKMNTEVCQRLGKALGYPWFKDDQENFPGATEENGVCTGEHVAESIAAEAAAEIERLRAELDKANEARSEAIRIMADMARQAGSWQGVAEGKDIVIRQIEAERDEATQRGDDWCDQAQKLRAERDRLRAGLLRVLQYENKCDQTGHPCDASRGCACSLEAETWCDGDGT